MVYYAKYHSLPYHALPCPAQEPALRGPGPEDSALVAIAMTRIPKLRF